MSKRKRIIGITGGVGSGKSLLLHLLKEEYGARIIEADRACNRLIEPGGTEVDRIAALLGEQVLTAGGGIDKLRMSEIIFAEPEKRKAVNALLHPATVAAVKDEIAASQESLIVYEAALPREGELPAICEKILYVYVTRANRIMRLAESRGYSAEKTRRIMASQMTEKDYRRLADAVIDNNGTPERSAARLRKILRQWDIGGAL